MINNTLSIKDVIALTVADIDIFLLQEEDQLTDKKKDFTTEEIRNQLKVSSQKIYAVLMENGFDIIAPLQTDYILLK